MYIFKNIFVHTPVHFNMNAKPMYILWTTRVVSPARPLETKVLAGKTNARVALLETIQTILFLP